MIFSGKWNIWGERCAQRSSIFSLSSSTLPLNRMIFRIWWTKIHHCCNKKIKNDFKSTRESKGQKIKSKCSVNRSINSRNQANFFLKIWSFWRKSRKKQFPPPLSYGAIGCKKITGNWFPAWSNSGFGGKKWILCGSKLKTEIPPTSTCKNVQPPLPEWRRNCGKPGTVNQFPVFRFSGRTTVVLAVRFSRKE